jgi:hypothetical protein
VAKRACHVDADRLRSKRRVIQRSRAVRGTSPEANAVVVEHMPRSSMAPVSKRSCCRSALTAACMRFVRYRSSCEIAGSSCTGENAITRWHGPHVTATTAHRELAERVARARQENVPVITTTRVLLRYARRWTGLSRSEFEKLNLSCTRPCNELIIFHRTERAA